MADQGMPGGTAHSKAEAEQQARASIRLANGPADDLIAGTMASVTIQGLWRALAIGLISVVVPALVLDSPLGFLAKWLAALAFLVVWTAITTPMLTRRRPVYLAVTPDELICYRVPKISQQPAAAHVLFRVSPRAARVKGGTGKQGRTWTVSFASRGPGTKRRLPRQHPIRAWLTELRLYLALQPLTVDRSWFRELGEVMNALQASGAEVPSALLEITAGG